MILITGGLGFIGSSLAESLVKNGYSVLLVARNREKLRNIEGFQGKVGVAYGDVTAYGWMQELILQTKPEAIFHLAGQVTSYESFENPFYDVDVNTKSTLAILEAMRHLRKPCRFILGSTLWVIGKPEKLPVNENTPCNPRNNYGADRLTSEHYCKIYHDVYDLDTVVMRLSNTYGVREQFNNPKKAALNYLLYKGYKGEPITIYSGGSVCRDYVYVSDVVSAAETLLVKGKPGELYFVGTGVETWFTNVGKWIAELTGGEVKYVDPPDFHNRIDIGDIVVDAGKLKSLGWGPKVFVPEGLALTLDYYKEMGF